MLYCTCGHFLHKGRGKNQKFIKYTMDFLSTPEYVIKKGRPHGHRYGEKTGDRRDETFRNRMIENGRDEDACRQMDALADEDHTHHLTPQEYCASGAQT